MFVKSEVIDKIIPVNPQMEIKIFDPALSCY